MKLQKKTEGNCDLGLGKHFFAMAPEAQAIKEKIHKLDFKNKN